MPRTHLLKSCFFFFPLPPHTPPCFSLWAALLYTSLIFPFIWIMLISSFLFERLLKVLAIIPLWMCLEKDAVRPVCADDRETWFNTIRDAKQHCIRVLMWPGAKAGQGHVHLHDWGRWILPWPLDYVGRKSYGFICVCGVEIWPFHFETKGFGLILLVLFIILKILKMYCHLLSSFVVD